MESMNPWIPGTRPARGLEFPNYEKTEISLLTSFQIGTNQSPEFSEKQDFKKYISIFFFFWFA